MTDTARLATAYRDLLDAATAVADTAPPPAGEWNAEQILAHVSLVTAATLATVSAVASGVNTTYDNRIASDTWTIGRLVAIAGGSAGLRDRIRVQGDVLVSLTGPALSEAELDTPVPARLLSGGTLLLDQTEPLRNLVAGLAEVELPGHTAQLLALLPEAGAAP